MKKIIIYIIAMIVAAVVGVLIKYLFLGHIDLWSIISSIIGGLVVICVVGWLNSRKKRK